ncbi:hypothetical protein [Aureibaculum luteum]|uniref:hypothetical protein n=1 Tax=Aureibaculum luteum TaxID=1548456 RepID=UPI001E35825F|nr:hypothetical protein [Aureibaculum luteum]
MATKVAIEGDLNNVNSKTWTTITNISRNGWIHAFENVIDNDIDFKYAKKEKNKKK